MDLPNILPTLAGEIIVVVVIAILLYVIYKIGKSLVKVILGILINSALGVAVIYVVNLLFGVGYIPLKVYTLIPLALFGLPAAGTLIILRLFVPF